MSADKEGIKNVLRTSKDLALDTKIRENHDVNAMREQQKQMFILL